MTRPKILTLALAAALLAGCGSDERDEAPGAAGPAPKTEGGDGAREATATEPAASTKRAAPAKRGRTIKAVSSQFGRILADGRGQAVYLFDREKSSKPECYGACARAWPPVLTKGRPVSGKGAGAARLGTTRRRNGKRQVTVEGRPVYYYVDDAPGRVLCHNVLEFGGLWLVVRPDGSPVP
jgi:predicted lipoprotein with Yx(FWY)xxD motif